MHGIPLSAILLLLTVSACVGNGPSGGAGLSAEPSIDPKADTGVVQGTIVNEETGPVAGAQAGLKEAAVQATSDERGIFLLRDVPPGDYLLLVGALGYESAQRPIHVEAGRIATVSFILRAVEAQSAVYAEVHHFTGFFDCALGTSPWVSACSYPYTAVFLTARQQGANLSQYGAPDDLEKNVFRFNLTIRPSIGQFVGELQWTPASAAATRMRINIKCGDYDPVLDDCTYPQTTGGSIRYGEGVGMSPVRVVVEKKTFFDLSKDKGKYDLAKNPQSWVMNYISLPHENAQLAFAQKFDVWDTVFYNGKGPDGYTVLGDG